MTWAEFSAMEISDILEIERARAREHERTERKDARMMAFLVTLWTGKPCKPEDLLGPGQEEELSEAEKEKRARVLAAYHAAGKRGK